MITNLFNWYSQVCDEWSDEESELFSDGVFMSKIQDVTRGYVHFNGQKFFVKTPHSRRFKFGAISTLFSRNDNRIATTSELMAERKYRELNYLTAYHKPVYINKVKNEILKPGSKYGVGPYVLVSPVLFDFNIHYATMFDLQEQEHLFYPNTDIDDKMFFNLENAIKNKDYFLQYLTEECYDEYIKYILLSIFEFSDDEHLGNVIICQNKYAKRFERIFVHDKESTAFNPYIAQNFDMNAVTFKTNNFTEYNGVPIDFKGERSFERILAVTKLVADGKMPKKYCEFLSTIANLDYEKFAKEVFEQTGIAPNSKQVDMYKYGSEKAGEIVIRQM